MKSIKEVASNARWEILGGRTFAENYEWWLDRCRRDANEGGKNYVGPTERPQEDPPEEGDDKAKLRLHLARCALPDRLVGILEEGVRPTNPVESVKHWWGIGSSFMLLHGISGAGKSVAAASALLRMRRVTKWDGGSHEDWDSIECAWTTADELARMGYFGDDANRFLKHLEKVTCLIIDDLGVEMMSESWRATLEGLLAVRFGRTKCRTLMTTNISASRTSKEKPSPFEERYGVRIARRIRESGSVVAVGEKQEWAP